MPAFLRQLVLVLDAQFVHGPLDSGPGLLSHHFGELYVIEIQAGGQHVLEQQIGRIHNALFFFFGRSGCRDDAAVDNGVPARRAHFFQHDDGGSRLLGFVCGRQSRKTAADHDHVVRLIPFFGQSGCLCAPWRQSRTACRQTCDGCRCSRCFQEASTGECSFRFFHVFLL